MRRLILSLSLLCFGQLSYAGNYGMAGCGLGSMAMGKSGSQISAATTNGTVGSQVFGITSGTSNCVSDKHSWALRSQENYLIDNFAQISKEAAQGDGEILKAFSATFGCSSDGYNDFSMTLKSSYQEIFSSPGALATLEALREIMAKNPSLTGKCSHIIMG